MNINGIYIVSNMVVQIDDTGIGMEWNWVCLTTYVLEDILAVLHIFVYSLQIRLSYSIL